MCCDLHNPTISQKTKSQETAEKGKENQKYEKWDFRGNLFGATYTSILTFYQYPKKKFRLIYKI